MGTGGPIKAGGPLLPRGYNASCPQTLAWGKSGGAPEPALSLSKGRALFETWASTLPLWRAPLPVQTQRRRPLRARNDSGLLSLCCQGPQEATGRGGSHHLLRCSSQVTTLLTFALSVLSFLQICLCRHSPREIRLLPRPQHMPCRRNRSRKPRATRARILPHRPRRRSMIGAYGDTACSPRYDSQTREP